MRAVIQRVKRASVEMKDQEKVNIGAGFLVLLGVEEGDREEDARDLADEIAKLRIMEDEEGKMNLSLSKVGGEILVVSQFTLFADTSKGRRPSFNQAAGAEKAEKLYHIFVEELKKADLSIKTGVFGAMMDIHLVNHGPVTLILDTTP